MMEYQFSFDRKRLIVFIAGLLLVGALTFVCGLIVGVGLWMPTQKELQLARGKALVPAGKAPTAEAESKATVPDPEKHATIAQTSPGTALAATPASTAPAAAAPAATSSVANSPVATSPVAKSPAATEPTVAAAAPDLDSERFVLQMGAFRDQKNAKQLQTELKEKGYVTRIYNGVDEDQKMWHMVRMGGYRDVYAASRAASEFSGKERIQALVRRSDAL